MTHRTFEVPSAGDGPTFELTGEYTKHHPVNPGEPWAESFPCLGIAPVGVLADYAMTASTDGKGGTIYRVGPVVRFLRAMIADPEALARFDALILDRYRPIELTTLVDVLGYVGEEVLARPTGPAST